MLGKIPYLHRQAKFHFEKIVNMIFWMASGNMNMDVSPYILKFQFFYKNICSTMAAWIHVWLL